MLGGVGLVTMEVATDSCCPLLEAGMSAFQLRLVHSIRGDTIGRELHCAVELLSEHRGFESRVALASGDEELLISEVPGGADGIDIEEVAGFGMQTRPLMPDISPAFLLTELVEEDPDATQSTCAVAFDTSRRPGHPAATEQSTAALDWTADSN